MAVNLPPQITNQPLQRLVLTSIRLKRKRRFVQPMMVVSVCDIIFLKVFDNNFSTDQRMSWFRGLKNDCSWPSPKGENLHFQTWFWKPCSDSILEWSRRPKRQIWFMRQSKLFSVIIMTWPIHYRGFGIVWSLGKDTAIKWSWESFFHREKIRGWKASIFDHPANSWWVFQLANIKSDFLSCIMVGCRASYDN